MWYAVETAFMNGEVVKSRICFTPGSKSPVGRCNAEHNEEPHNRCEEKFDGMFEFHTDWFQTEEQAIAFNEGKITYISHYDAYYHRGINSTLTKFKYWEAVPVDIDNGLLPYIGKYEKHMLDYKPYWVR